MELPEWTLKGTTALVTGASSGLGRSMSRALALAGAEVALASRNKEGLEELKRDLDELDCLTQVVHIDVKDEDSVGAAVSWIRSKWGAPDLVVNNAGLGMSFMSTHYKEKGTPFFEVEPKKFKELFETNVLGYFLVSSACAKLMIAKNHNGRIVNISANKETMVREGNVPYGPSRAASEAMSAIMVKDLRGYKIAVNVLKPGGATDTNIIPHDYKVRHEGQLLDPSVMARPITFLASVEARGLTGQTIVAKEFDSWLRQFRVSRPKDAFL